MNLITFTFHNVDHNSFQKGELTWVQVTWNIRYNLMLQFIFTLLTAAWALPVNTIFSSLFLHKEIAWGGCQGGTWWKVSIIFWYIVNCHTPTSLSSSSPYHEKLFLILTPQIR